MKKPPGFPGGPLRLYVIYLSGPYDNPDDLGQNRARSLWRGLRSRALWSGLTLFYYNGTGEGFCQGLIFDLAYLQTHNSGAGRNVPGKVTIDFRTRAVYM
jgi:hypothetical protein